VVEVFGRDAYRLGALEITTSAPVFIDVGANIGAFALDILIIIVTFLSSRACPATQ
jgi:hypothetical protein